MAADEVELERIEVGIRNPDFGQFPEAGVDAINDLLAGKKPFDYLAGCTDTPPSSIGQPNGFPVRDRVDLAKR